MRTLIQLSDLHFGRTDPLILGPLLAQVRVLRPDLVVVSGDLTQRARTKQFQAARRFLDMLPKPRLVVPGNHDVPMYNVASRFLAPLDKYQKIITPDLEPFFVDDEIAVTGINTARSLTIKGGRINEEQMERVYQRLSKVNDSLTKIVVTHHPFMIPADGDEEDLVGRADLAMQVFSECKVDLLMSGHLHTSQAVSTAERYDLDGYAALSIQAGTATSTRERGEANSFNVLRIGERQLTIERMSWVEEERVFLAAKRETFSYSGNGWTPMEVVDGPAAG